jgi:outer membrane protein TolC
VIERREAEQGQARTQVEAAELAVRAGVRRAELAYRASVRELQVFERDVLVAARENQRLLDVAYQEGEFGLSAILLLRNQLLDAEFGYWDAWERNRLAAVTLRSVTAHNLDDLIALPERRP